MAIGGLLTLCVGLIGSLGVLTSEVIKGINNADVADFIFVNGSDKFRCYITDDTNNYISIGWGREAKEAPTNLSVPEIMTNNDVDYTVTGIVQGAFRSCDFETISLPDTITEIEEEAFAYCDQLKTFTLPYGVTEIKDSAFIDCRKMTYFLYKNEDGAIVSTNDKITSIGSHAFASCVSLLDFSFSTVLQEIQECAFQRCISFTRIYLPSAEYTGSSTTPNNPYTIGKYAFADCSKLEFVYFEKNLTGVNSYAFANCYITTNASMILHYGYSGKYPGDPAFTTNWRRKNIDPTSTAGNYSIESDHIIVRQHHKFPGLRFSIVTGKDIEIDCSKSGTSNKIKLDTTKNPYIEIYQWNAPAETDPETGTIYEDYYNTKTKALEIPGQIKIDETTTYPVKVIKKGAFANKADDIYSLKFNSGLIQICKEAFLKDTEIKSIDFTKCDTLLEISNDIFNQRKGTRNSYVTSLALPHTLEYIGMYAFWAFDKVQTLKFTTDENDPDKKPHLKVLGGACFGELGCDNGGIGITVELPGTLDDRAAIAANINYARNTDYNEQNWAAIGPYVFGSTVNDKKTETSQVTVVTMDPNPTEGLSCSLAPNAMNRARRLVKFVANSNLAMVGSEVFKNCNDLREVFLTTAKGKALADAGMQYPWGSKAADGSTYESSILSSGGDGDKPDLVLYLDGPAPGKISTDQMTDVKVKWNSETSKTYNTEFGYANVAKQTADILYQSRSSNPTFINMDFNFKNGSLLYWKPNSTGGGEFTTEPKNVNDYNNGLIVLAKQKGSDHYVVARYFAANNKVVDEIDLTGLDHDDFGDISSKITEIGDEAFAVNSANKKGYYFILPHTVTKISERAFFRKVDTAKSVAITTVGARIVTYKDSNGNIQSSQSGETYEAAKTRCKNASAAADIYGYCALPNNLTHLGRFAFYSNVFKDVWIPKTLSFYGVGAFYSHYSGEIGSKLESIVIEDNGADEDEDPETVSNPNFKEINNGIYYVGSATGKTLLYQAQNIGGTLTIDSDTKAIGMAACADTIYSKIVLNDGLKTIYGSAFEYNYQLTEIEGGKDLEYISAIAHNSADEVYQDNPYYQNIDYRDYYAGDYAIRASRTTAFRNCTKLKTFNFKKLTSLIKIGHAAFYGCNNLEELTGGDTYNYYKPNSDGTLPTSPATSKTNGVLDLAPCTNLRVIGANSFTSKKISHVHLPYSNGELSVARDAADSVILSGADDSQPIFYDYSPIYLVGDIAYKTYRGNDSITSVDKNKWSNKWYGSDRSKVYFHAFDATDILNGNTEGSVHYWIKHPTDANGYVLLDSKDIATKYFQKNPTYTEVRPA